MLLLLLLKQYFLLHEKQNCREMADARLHLLRAENQTFKPIARCLPE